jgi:hypothetical protein
MEQPDDRHPIAFQQVECKLFGQLAASFGLHARRISEQFQQNLNRPVS